jgi:hypothetical protein
LHIAILPADELVLEKVRDVIAGMIRLEFENQPADMREEKSF